ncbi:hypothetical protein [Amphritea sp. HPY]|uniref:hypothetical protein n=1 Tax=Amphritea sp. HPY TaxID=3421652 RepID=UPI003D7E8AC1
MEIYLVGGAVRDQLLSFPVYDKDWVVVGATPQQMLDQGFRPVGKDFPVFIHPETGEEYALARTERKSGKGYTGFQYYASPDVTLEQDLIRRDLTINAMAQDDNGQIIDPYNGQQDLQQRILRHVSPAFAEDPLRVLRVARFAARYTHLGFTIAEPTLELMRQLAASDELQHLTAERVWQEFQRALGEPAADVFITTLQRCGALTALFPELVQLASDSHSLLLLRAELAAPSRFAILMSRAVMQRPADEQQAIIRSFCERQRSPNLYRDLALQLCSCAEQLINFASLDAGQRLQLILNLDLVRRSEKLTDLITAAKVIAGQSSLEAEQLIPELLRSMTRISPQQLMSEGFKGKALGQEIQLRQLQICQQQITGTQPGTEHESKA